MKKVINLTVLVSVGMGLLTGCHTLQIEDVKETQIVRSEIPVQVREKRSKSLDVKALVESELAQAGFAVNQADPFMTVTLNSRYSPFDSFGNYNVYEGGCFVNVTRADSQVFLNKQMNVQGERQLEEERALDAAEDALATAVAKEVVAVCNEKTTGVSSKLVTLKGYEEEDLSRFSATLRKTSGVLSCRRIKDGRKEIQYRVIYDARKFPDGIYTLIRNAAN